MEKKEFLELLHSTKLKNQKPDGYYIIDAMKRAIIDHKGLVRWTELCYCPTPLAHERGTVYDEYFTDIETEPIKKHETFEGKSFMDKIFVN